MKQQKFLLTISGHHMVRVMVDRPILLVVLVIIILLPTG
jgi:hypothetical protein